MKSVLISIQPKWCELIASGKKTVELRKSRPNLETPFKCYIYKTKKRILRDITRKGEVNWFGDIAEKTTIIASSDLDGGKVIGEFMCDFIDETYPIINQITKQFFYLDEWVKGKVNRSNTCLTVEQLNAYGKGKTLYGWHITDLKIYDKPKELGEFRTICPKKPYCANRKSPCLEFGHCTKKITRPPQSWCYVEEL